VTRPFFFSSRRRHTSFSRDWSSDVCSSDLLVLIFQTPELHWAALPLVLVTTIVLFSGRRENRENRNSLAHQLEYNSLVHYLTIARQQAEQLNRQLRSEERRVGKECITRLSCEH